MIRGKAVAPYRVAIVGCGRIGCFFDDDRKRSRRIWTHAGAYAANARTRLVAVADLDPVARALAARRWKVPRTYANVREMLSRERLDIVSVCTPSSSHIPVAQMALSMGVPGIWLEKPVATQVREAEALLPLAGKAVVAVNHIRRWDRAYEIARDWIQRGQLGDLVTAGAWYTNGVSNMGSHLFDTLRFLFGEPDWMWAAKPIDPHDPDPTLSGVVSFGRVLCHVQGAGREMLLFDIEVTGTRGQLRISENGRLVSFRPLVESPHYTGYKVLGAPRFLWKGEDGKRMLKAVEDIVTCMENGGKPRCAFLDGLLAIEMVAAFQASSRIGRPIPFPLEKRWKNEVIAVR